MGLPSYFRNGYRRIKRIVAWIPILWKDEDWDHSYLFELLRFKISRMRQEIEKNKRHQGYEKHVRDMKIAETLLARMGFTDFYWNLSKQLEDEEKRGKCHCPEKIWQFDRRVSKSGEPNLYRMIDLSCPYCKKARNRWDKRKRAKEKADFDYLFTHLHKKIHQWWD